jgi:ribose 5-phosphate isomerase
MAGKEGSGAGIDEELKEMIPDLKVPRWKEVCAFLSDIGDFFGVLSNGVIAQTYQIIIIHFSRDSRRQVMDP